MTNPTIEDIFADLEIDDSPLEKIWEARRSLKTYSELMATNPNAVVLTETIFWANATNNDGDSRRHRAWMNLLKLFALEFLRDPYWNSKIGWLQWFWVCYSRYDSYYPLGWFFHYDPLNHYRTGEPPRPEGLECPMPDDPFNIKGDCFVHPEWYTKEYKDAKDKSSGASNDSI